MSWSPKQAFMRAGAEDGDEEYFDNLIRVPRKGFTPNVPGRALMMSLKRKRLNVGGLGSAKTRNMCEFVNNMLLKYPGGRGIIGRKDLGDLKKTTQAEFLEKVVAPESIDRFNINDNTVYYKNGSLCHFMETKTPSNFKSMEIIVYGLDEADENEEGEGKDRLMTMLDGRLRQKIKIGEREVPVPYAGIWTYNPTTDDHWLAKLEDNPDPETEIVRSSTYDNPHLPGDYIPNLLATLAPWEINSLVHGNRASRPKGRPVIHGFTVEANVRPLSVFPTLPLRRSWDFGYNHPCVSFFQYDPLNRRFLKIRELLGSREQLQFFAPRVLEMTRSLVGPGFTIFDYSDPHGKDQRDVGESSVEYLRIHHGVHCLSKRTEVKTGLDELQTLIIGEAPYFEPGREPGPGVAPRKERRFLVDPSCKVTIAAYLGGYYRDDDGKPVKDDLHDHPVDCLSGDTRISTPLGPIHLADLRRHDWVLTREGPRQVLHAWETGIAEPYRLAVTNGAILQCTGNHPFFTENRGFVAASELTQSDTFCTWAGCTKQKPSNSTGLYLSDTPTTPSTGCAITFDGSVTSTRRFGSRLMGKSLKATTSTTRMVTHSIIHWITSKLSLLAATRPITTPRLASACASPTSSDISTPSGLWLLTGMLHPTGSAGTLRMGSAAIGLHVERCRRFAASALKSLLFTGSTKKRNGSAQYTANKSTEAMPESTTCQQPVFSVGRDSLKINTPENSLVAVPVRLVSRFKREGKSPVFNLTVEGSPEFFAEGVLVHNCDRYGTVHTMNAGLVHRFKKQNKYIPRNAYTGY